MAVHAGPVATECCISHLPKNVGQGPCVFVVMQGIIPLLSALIGGACTHVWGWGVTKWDKGVLSAVGMAF